MLDERKATILRAVVSEYIKTAQPVGSAHVSGFPGIDVSSATIRNDMAQLEADGYLHQPHTSAGRVPTDKGYRAFVDELTTPSLHLGTEATTRVKDFFDTTHGEIEHMLTATTHLLADLTHQAAVVVAPSTPTSSPVRSIHLVRLAPSVALLIGVLANGQVDKWTIDVDEHLSEETLARAAAHLGAHLEGRAMNEIATVPVLADPIGEVVVASCREVRIVAGGADVEQVYVGGTAQVAESFEAIETVRRVLTILEQQLVVVTLLRDVLDRGLQVAIGTETGMAPLADCSVVVAPYEIDGTPAGSLALLGSTRMDYPQALAAVALVSQRLGRRLTEG